MSDVLLVIVATIIAITYITVAVAIFGDDDHEDA